MCTSSLAADLNVSHWTGSVPNDPNVTALFSSIMTSPITAFTDSDVTIRSLRFENANSIAVTGFGTVHLGGTTTTNGSVVVSQGSHEQQSRVAVNADALEIDVNSGSRLEFDHQVTFNESTLTKTGGGTVQFNNLLNTGSGTLVASEGIVSGVGVVVSLDNLSATVAPGRSPGTLTVNGDYTQGSAATLEIELAGTAPGQHDQLLVVGSATLDGTLDIVPLPTYSDPTSRGTADEIVLLTAGTRSGNFNSVEYDGAPLATDFTKSDGSFRDHVGNGLFRSVAYTDTGVTFQNLLALPGDGDGDQDVDITDFNILASNFDPTSANSATNDWTTTDFDGDGDVDITDFNSLSSNFAPDGYGSVGADQVPEPSTLALIGLFVMIIGIGRWHKIK